MHGLRLLHQVAFADLFAIARRAVLQADDARLLACRLRNIGGRHVLYETGFLGLREKDPDSLRSAACDMGSKAAAPFPYAVLILWNRYSDSGRRGDAARSLQADSGPRRRLIFEINIVRDDVLIKVIA